MESKSVVDTQTYINKALWLRLSKRTDDDIKRLYDDLNDSNISYTIESVKKLIAADEDRLTYEEINKLERQKLNALDMLIFCFKIFLFTVFLSYEICFKITLAALIVCVIGNIHEYYDAGTKLIKDKW
uniref:Uncharacterized protein n=1 Tax=viral metagenome TaxID=1070528 RepID=A0A6C0C929_9ZZZZ